MIGKALFVFVVFIFVSIVVEQFYAKRIKMGPGVELRNGVFVVADPVAQPLGPVQPLGPAQPQDPN